MSLSTDPATPSVGALADFAGHRIEGFAHEGGRPFSVPLFTQVLGNLWMGGCPVVALPKEFGYVVNLYPWGEYELHPHQMMLEHRLFDSAEQPLESAQLHLLARCANDFARLGPTLVHCQAGLNRSGLITALALLQQGWSARQAIERLRKLRCSEVLCNAHFRGWLERESARLRGEPIPAAVPATLRAGGWER